MEEFNPEIDGVKPTVALHAMDQHKMQRQYPAYLGLDVHKNTIAWAVAKDGRQEPEYRGEIANPVRDCHNNRPTSKVVHQCNSQRLSVSGTYFFKPLSSRSQLLKSPILSRKITNSSHSYRCWISV